jgi:hypothetical protein
VRYIATRIVHINPEFLTEEYSGEEGSERDWIFSLHFKPLIRPLRLELVCGRLATHLKTGGPGVGYVYFHRN